MLIAEAQRWVGTAEREGDNRGEMVERFQKAVDGVATREPWCMCFVQYCVKAVDDCFEESSHSPLFKSEHVLTTWNRSQPLKIDEPQPGCIAVWQNYHHGEPTAQGHVGIVVAVNEDGTFTTVEGNTSPPGPKAKDTPDGVYLKRHPKSKMGATWRRLKGFLRLW